MRYRLFYSRPPSFRHPPRRLRSQILRHFQIPRVPMPLTDRSRFRSPIAVAPVLVTDRSGNIIDGLQPNQFRLFDNGKEQDIQVDVAFEPISLVVLIEKAARVESILPQIKHLGSLLPLVVGDHGEAAVLAFDSPGWPCCRISRRIRTRSKSQSIKSTRAARVRA